MPDNPNFIDEKNIPDNWTPIDVPTVVPGRIPLGAPAPPVPHDMPQYFSGSLSPALQHDGHFVATEMVSPRIPKTALMPFGNQANPNTNAAAQSTSKIIATQVVAAAPSTGLSNVILQWDATKVPSIFVSPSASGIAGGVETITGAFISEPFNTVFSAAPPSPNDHVVTASGAPSTVLTLTGAATITPQVAYFISSINTSTPTGFTQVSTTATYFKLLNTATPVSPNQGNVGANGFGWASAILFLASDGTTPVFTQKSARTGANANSIQMSFTPTAGETTAFIYMFFSNASGGFFTSPCAYNVVDDKGNNWVKAVEVQNINAGGTGNGCQLIVFVAQNVPASATTIQFTQLPGSPAANLIGLQIYTICATHLTQASPGLPIFQLLQPAQIPFLDTSKIASGQLALARGGTGVDLSAAGGTNQFLAMDSSHVISAIQPSFANLSGNIAISQMKGGLNASFSTFWRGDGTWSPIVAPPQTANIPAFVQGNSGFTASGTGVSVAYSGNNTAGNTLTVMFRVFGSSGSPTISDTQLNVWTLRQNVVNGSSNDLYWDCINCKGGANTVTVAYGAATGSNQAVIAEYSNVAGFDQIASTTGSGATGTTPNITPGADNALIIGWFSNETANSLTFTAGTGYTVRNNAQGNVVLEDKIQSFFTSINATIGFSSSVSWFASIVSYIPSGSPANGLPAEKASADLTAQGAAIGATTLYTPTATGMYRVSAYLKVTTVDATSSTLGALTITYTDGTDSVAQTAVMQMANEAGAAVTSNSGNTTAAKLIGRMEIWALTGVAIQYATAYASNIAGTMKYEVHLRVEAL